MRVFPSRHELSHITLYLNLFRSPKSLERWREKALKKLVRHATSTVPMWKKMYSDLGISASKITRLEDIRLLPITSKHTYLGKVDEEYLDHSALRRGMWRTTSGSSGQPFSIFTGAHRTCRFCFSILRSRFLIWNGMVPTKIHSLKLAQIQTTSERTADRLIISLDQYRENPSGAVDDILAFKPYLFETYAAIILDVARRVEASGRTDVQIPYVVTYGETLLPSGRAYIEKVLGCEVYDRYGLEEMAVVSVECKEHNGQHIFNDFFIFEIVDEDGNRVPDGESGRIIITDLYNFNMPFIRYDTGDRGSITEAACQCGVKLPRLFLDGRDSVFLTFPDRDVHQFELDEAIIHLHADVVQFQFVKKSDTEVRIRIIPGPSFSSISADDIIRAVQAIVGEPVKLHVDLVQEIMRSPRGKMPIVVDESRK